jgi:hypothetical protein
MSNKLNNKKYNSKFFKFIPHQVEKSIKLSYYKGWNKSLIIKIFFNSSHTINNLFIKKNFPQILNKEKIFIITSGKSKFNSEMKNFELKKLDAISTFSDKFEYNFNCKKNTELFIISSEKFKIKKHKSIYFNFKKDIKVIDIWGGKCLSRPYSGSDINIVMFDLKKGFKFNDKGHSNEQITWLVSGSMNFYSHHLKDKLTKKKGIDIGSFHQHGGLSNGAIGFDAFFPKRSEKKYKHKVRITKF